MVWLIMAAGNNLDVDLDEQSDESEGLLTEEDEQEENEDEQKKVGGRNIALSMLSKKCCH